MRHPRGNGHQLTCALCGGKEAGRVTLRSHFRDVSQDRWRLTARGVRLLSALRAAEEQALIDEQCVTQADACAWCGQPMDPLAPEDRAALGDGVLLLCWDCFVECGPSGPASA